MIEITYHTKHYFENISRSFFFNNAWLGACFMALLLVFSPVLFLFGLAASMIGYWAAVLYSTPKVLKDCGLITINGFFFGISFASLFERNFSFYVSFLLGAMLIPVLTKAAYQVLHHWKITPLIVPYIVMTWVLTLIAQQGSAGLRQAWWQDESWIPMFTPSSEWPLQFLAAIGRTTGELFYVTHPYFGFCLLILVTAFHPRRGMFYLLGNIVALAIAWMLSDGSMSVQYGTFSFSSGLVGLGLASMPEKINWKSILMYCALSAIFTMALNQYLGEHRLPTLTLPFVLTFWTAIVSQSPRVSISWAPPTDGMPQLSILKGMNIKSTEPA